MELEVFLRRAGWGGAHCVPLAGDASARRYFRLSRENQNAILMDARALGPDVTERFLSISQHLLDGGLSAPRVLFADASAGLAVLEDLGDDLFSTVLTAHPDKAPELYAAAARALIKLQKRPDTLSLPTPSAQDLVDMIQVTFQWYCLPAQNGDELSDALLTQLTDLAPTEPRVSLRDFHAENMIWLPDRQDEARVGLLDFQDAFRTHPVYDLVSMLQDARRDISTDAAAAAIQAFRPGIDLDRAAFDHACAVIGLQRNLRILGVLARLERRDGKRGYLDYAPRVWRWIQINLRHPSMAEISRTVAQTLPPPTAAYLAKLRTS